MAFPLQGDKAKRICELHIQQSALNTVDRLWEAPMVADERGSLYLLIIRGSGRWAINSGRVNDREIISAIIYLRYTKCQVMGNQGVNVAGRNARLRG